MRRTSAFPQFLRRCNIKGRAAAALCALALACVFAAPAVAEESVEKTPLQKIQDRGVLTVALYKDFPPFSDKGVGIDVDLATALAAKLGLKMTPLWFDAGDNMERDFRFMVVKGHPLGYGPADMMMHVPVDKEYMQRLKDVEIFAPYHRERYAMARNLEKIPTLDNLEPFEKQSLSVEDNCMGELVMLSADNGRYRENLKIFKTGGEAVAALRSGAVPAALAQQGELEGGLAGASGFEIDLPPQPVLRMRQWALGLAVRSDNLELAKLLQKAMNDLVEEGKLKSIMQSYGVKLRQP